MKNSKLNRDITVYMLERSELIGNIYPLATEDFFQNFYVSKFISFDGLIYILEGSQALLLKITLGLVLPQQNHSANPDSVATSLGLHCQYWVKPTYAV